MECICALNAVVSAIQHLARGGSRINEGFEDLTNPLESAGPSRLALYLMLLLFALLLINTGRRPAPPTKAGGPAPRDPAEDSDPIY